ncbi:hypothetical protein BD560DRAFT_341828, partial [Blakeslea trispora]
YSYTPLTNESREMLRALTGPYRFYYLKESCNYGDEYIFSHSSCTEEERK